MVEKTDWEVVDVPAAARTQSTAHHLIRSVLGPWWRWKMAGFAIIAVAAVAVVIALAGVLAVMIVAGVALSVAVRQIRLWLGGRHAGPAVVRRNGRP